MKNKLIISIIIISIISPIIYFSILYIRIAYAQYEISVLKKQVNEKFSISLIELEIKENSKTNSEIPFKNGKLLLKGISCDLIETNYAKNCKLKNGLSVKSIGYNNNYLSCIKPFKKQEYVIKNIFDINLREYCKIYYKKYFKHIDEVMFWNGKMEINNIDLKSGVFLWNIYLTTFQFDPKYIFFDESEYETKIITIDHDKGSQIIFIFYNGQVFNAKFNETIDFTKPLPIKFKASYDNEIDYQKMLFIKNYGQLESSK